MIAAPADAVARLRLIRSENVGPVTYRQLIARFGTAGAALDALPDLARRGGGKSPKICDTATAERELDVLQGFGAGAIFIGTPEYPQLLAQTESAPPVVAAKGKAELLERPAVAMVGARNASAAAVRFARGLAADLADAGFVVVSGLARGIDAAAHEGALAGGTIAVIAGGIDICYPPETADLQRRLGGSDAGSQGLVVAEMAFGTQPQARHFPRRNRIIAGLCAGTVVVEGAVRSGSLITARLAAEAGREVMAIPGSPLDPRAQGCNQLIREGATLVQSAADIIEAMSGFSAGQLPLAADAGLRNPADDVRGGCGGRCGSGVIVADAGRRSTSSCGSAGCRAPALRLCCSTSNWLGRLARHAGGRVASI